MSKATDKLEVTCKEKIDDKYINYGKLRAFLDDYKALTQKHGMEIDIAEGKVARFFPIHLLFRSDCKRNRWLGAPSRD